MIPCLFLPMLWLLLLYSTVCLTTSISSYPSSTLLTCFNSQAVQPSRQTQCEPDQICYGEYYALRTSENHYKSSQPTLVHYFDRFCVHRQHCVARGFWPEHRPCMELAQLDAAVANTFRNKLRSERLDPSRLVHSRFCCCADRNLCNRMDVDELAARFNLSSAAIRGQPRPSRRGSSTRSASSSSSTTTKVKQWWWIGQILLIFSLLLSMIR